MTAGVEPVGIDWFRVGETLNACYNAVDRHVIRGLADAIALAGDRDYSYARLLTEVAACAGVLRACGVEAGTPVGVLLDERPDAVVVLLAVLRLGGVYVDGEVAGVLSESLRVVVTERGERRTALGDATPSAVIVLGSDGFTAPGDLAWDDVLRSGRHDPAGCADLPPMAPMLVHHGPSGRVERSTAAHLHDIARGGLAGGWPSAVLATLLAGRTLHPSG